MIGVTEQRSQPAPSPVGLAQIFLAEAIGTIVAFCGLTLLHFVLAWFSILLSRETGNLAVIWLPNSVLIGLLLGSSLRRGLTLALVALPGATFANLAFGDSLAVAFGLATANFAEVAVCFLLLTALVGSDYVLGGLRQFFWFLLSALVAAPAVGAMIGAWVVHGAFEASWSAVLQTWWISDGVSLLAIVPLIQVLRLKGWRFLAVVPPNGTWVFVAYLCLFLGTAFLLLGTSHSAPLLLFGPVLVLAALKHESATVLAGALVILISMVVGRLTTDHPIEGLLGIDPAALAIQYLYVVSAVPALAIAIVVGDRRKAFEALDAANREKAGLVSELAQREDRLGKALVDRKMAEEQLRKSESFYRLFYEGAPAPLHEIDSQGQIIRVSNRWLEGFGYRREEVVGRKNTEFMTEESRDCAIGEVLPWFFESGECQDIECQFLTKDGEAKDILLSAVVMGRAERVSEHSYAVLTDITGLKRAEAMALAASQREQDALRRSNEELERFAYVAAHDLQTPLRHITSYAELLREEHEDQLDDEGRKYIGFMVGGAERMRQLIRDLLAYSRVHVELSHELINCQKVVCRVAAQLEGSEDNHDVRVNVDALPVVNESASLIYRLFENLIGNSAKYRGDDPPYVQITAVPSGVDGWWKFSIADNGIGIDPKFRERVFQIFQRLHTQGRFPGTGIVLAICRRIVECHGGKIWLDESFEPGSRFFFTLPIVQEKNDVRGA